MKQQMRRQPIRRGPRVLRRASTVRAGASAASMRSLRSGYAFSHQQGFGELITTGSMMSVRPRPRSARIKGPMPRFGQQSSSAVDLDEVDGRGRWRRRRGPTVCHAFVQSSEQLCGGATMIRLKIRRPFD